MSSPIGDSDAGGGVDAAQVSGTVAAADVGLGMDTSLVSPVAFASVDQVSAAWKPIPSRLFTFTALLLDGAGFWIRNRKPHVQNSDPAAEYVSIMVVRSRLVQEKFQGAHTGAHNVGGKLDSWAAPRTATIQEMAQDLVFTDYHRTVLGINESVEPTAVFGNRSRGPDPIQPWVLESWDPGAPWYPPYS